MELTESKYPHASSTGKSKAEPNISGPTRDARLVVNLQSSLVRRSAGNKKGAGSAEDRERHRLHSIGQAHVSNLPVPVSNLMVANWAAGREDDPFAISKALVSCPFACVVIVFSSAVAENDRIAQFFLHLDKGFDPLVEAGLDPLLNE